MKSQKKNVQQLEDEINSLEKQRRWLQAGGECERSAKTDSGKRLNQTEEEKKEAMGEKISLS